MTDLSSIAGALSAIKTATDVVKVIRSADAELTSAELKLRIADLTGALADARLALVGIQSDLSAKEAEIDRLSLALRIQADVIRHGAAYYEKSTTGEPLGDPYCSHCFEVKHVLVHIHQDPSNRHASLCPSCRNAVHWQRRQVPGG